MRRVRAFLFLAEEQLKRKSFWVFLIVIVLIGPVFVVLNSETNLAERELRPLLSESATVDHFKIGRSTLRGIYNKESIMLFRSPNSESAPDYPVSPAFVRNLSGFYRTLLPILMTVAGVLAFPSRRRLAAIRIVSPCGRWGCFLMIAGVLTLQVVLLGVLAGVSAALALALTKELASGTIWFVGQYYGAVIVYTLGFALVGFVIAELIRNRTVALLIGLVLVIGILPFISLGQGKLYTASLQWYSASGATGNPLLLAAGISALTPPEAALDRLLWKTQLARSPDDSRDTPLQRMLNWGSLAMFMGFWLAIIWFTFPHIPRKVS